METRRRDSAPVVLTLCLLAFAVLVPSPPVLLVSAAALQHRLGMQVCGIAMSNSHGGCCRVLVPRGSRLCRFGEDPLLPKAWL